MSDKQKTLQSEVKLSGVGLHTGAQVNICIKPAPENHGYKFKRTDISDTAIVDADIDNVVSTERGTSIEKNGVRVNTTEHVLAALYGSGIDNALIELNGPEVPILDGSAKEFIRKFNEVGVVDQQAYKDYLVLKSNIAFEDTAKNVEMLAVPAEEFRITVMVDYNSPLLGTQHASMYHIGEFQKEISNCRTFVFLRELMQLVNAGLIKGGDVDNAIVMVDTKLSLDEEERLAATFNRDRSELEKIGIGILNNVKLQYENEPARHKLLDIVGDLALIGRPIKGHILAARPGHSGNVAFGKILKDIIKKENKKTPSYDPNSPAIYNINDIMGMLPHRYPFLLIDKIIEMSENHVVGVKNVTFNESFFQGHFPGNPVMPGVLLVEAMAQTGGILVLSSVDEPHRYSTYFAKMDKVKFREKVLPGDSVVFLLELLSPIRRGLCHMKATAFVRDRVVAEGELMAQIVKER
jgi:UDP-3-O-[3-hydroxymyristoyl] N-acetylglucosamine deacetylase/3-hydroxyacyl-[acyl-carrier-protein] dehydratase